jgi:hypothetical protein
VYWRISFFRPSVPNPCRGCSAAEWDDTIARIKQWNTTYPESATARIALAKAFYSRGWAARGTGYASAVGASAWGSFDSYVELSKATLLEAAKLKEKDPYWYEAMQLIALSEGWDKEQARELFDQAIAFEPTYYHYYREYANFLLPKWYGQEGETQSLAEESLERLDEPTGSIVYFEIASLLACQCNSERDTLSGVSWPRIKQGYANTVGLYGTTNLKLNRFAYMSFVASDKNAVRNAFLEIGEQWNQTVWRDQLHFETARAWGLNP